MTGDDTRDTQTHLFDGPDDWVVYPIAYWDASEQILDAARENSLLLQPGMFLLRHFVELTFKELIHRAGRQVPVTHDLASLWRDVRALPTIADNKHADEAMILPITEYVQQLVQLDRSSFVFRYPVDTKGQPHGLGGTYSTKRVLGWARGLHEALTALEGALEMSYVDRQFEAEMWLEYGP